MDVKERFGVLRNAQECSGVFWCVLQCMGISIFTNASQRLRMFGTVQDCLGMLRSVSNVQDCLGVFRNGQAQLAVFRNAYGCLEVLGNVQECFGVFTDVQDRLRMLGNVQGCFGVFRNAWECFGAWECWECLDAERVNMFRFAWECLGLLRYVQEFQECSMSALVHV